MGNIALVVLARKSRIICLRHVTFACPVSGRQRDFTRRTAAARRRWRPATPRKQEGQHKPCQKSADAGHVSNAIFDLTKPEVTLTKGEEGQVKKVARSLLETLKNEKLVLDWKKRQTTRAAVRTRWRPCWTSSEPTVRPSGN